MRWAVSCLAAGALALAVPACGDGDQDLSARAAAALQAQVGEVRAAVVAHDADDARVELAQLRAKVGQLRSGGEVGDERAQGILAAADAVESQLGLLRRPSRTTDEDAEEGNTDEGDTDDLPQHIDEEVRRQVEEARRRAQEQIREAEKKIEDAEKNAGGRGGRGRG